MTFAMHRAMGISFVLSDFIACSMVRATCNDRQAGVSDAADAAFVGDGREIVTDASADTKADDAPRATKDASALCELVAKRLQFMANWRNHPSHGIGREAMVCDPGTSPQVCWKTTINEGGLIGAGFFENGPGEIFYFQLEEGEKEGGAPMTQLTCQTIGLSAVSQPERGVERCEVIKNGALAGMTIILDSRCDRLHITAFDEPFRARAHDAGKVDPCDFASPDRLAAQPVLCGPLANFRRKEGR